MGLNRKSLREERVEHSMPYARPGDVRKTSYSEVITRHSPSKGGLLNSLRRMFGLGSSNVEIGGLSNQDVEDNTVYDLDKSSELDNIPIPEGFQGKKKGGNFENILPNYQENRPIVGENDQEERNSSSRLTGFLTGQRSSPSQFAATREDNFGHSGVSRENDSIPLDHPRYHSQEQYSNDQASPVRGSQTGNSPTSRQAVSSSPTKFHGSSGRSPPYFLKAIDLLVSLPQRQRPWRQGSHRALTSIFTANLWKNVREDRSLHKPRVVPPSKSDSLRRFLNRFSGDPHRAYWANHRNDMSLDQASYQYNNPHQGYGGDGNSQFYGKRSGYYESNDFRPSKIRKTVLYPRDERMINLSSGLPNRMSQGVRGFGSQPYRPGSKHHYGYSPSKRARLEIMRDSRNMEQHMQREMLRPSKKRLPFSDANGTISTKSFLDRENFDSDDSGYENRDFPVTSGIKRSNPQQRLTKPQGDSNRSNRMREGAKKLKSPKKSAASEVSSTDSRVTINISNNNNYHYFKGGESGQGTDSAGKNSECSNSGVGVGGGPDARLANYLSDVFAGKTTGSANIHDQANPTNNHTEGSKNIIKTARSDSNTSLNADLPDYSRSQFDDDEGFVPSDYSNSASPFIKGDNSQSIPMFGVSKHFKSREDTRAVGRSDSKQEVENNVVGKGQHVLERSETCGSAMDTSMSRTVTIQPEELNKLVSENLGSVNDVVGEAAKRLSFGTNLTNIDPKLKELVTKEVAEANNKQEAAIATTATTDVTPVITNASIFSSNAQPTVTNAVSANIEEAKETSSSLTPTTTTVTTSEQKPDTTTTTQKETTLTESTTDTAKVVTKSNPFATTLMSNSNPFFGGGASAAASGSRAASIFASNNNATEVKQSDAGNAAGNPTSTAATARAVFGSNTTAPVENKNSTAGVIFGNGTTGNANTATTTAIVFRANTAGVGTGQSTAATVFGSNTNPQNTAASSIFGANAATNNTATATNIFDNAGQVAANAQIGMGLNEDSNMEMKDITPEQSPVLPRNPGIFGANSGANPFVGQSGPPVVFGSGAGSGSGAGVGAGTIFGANSSGNTSTLVAKSQNMFGGSGSSSNNMAGQSNPTGGVFGNNTAAAGSSFFSSNPGGNMGGGGGGANIFSARNAGSVAESANPFKPDGVSSGNPFFNPGGTVKAQGQNTGAGTGTGSGIFGQNQSAGSSIFGGGAGATSGTAQSNGFGGGASAGGNQTGGSIFNSNAPGGNQASMIFGGAGTSGAQSTSTIFGGASSSTSTNPASGGSHIFGNSSGTKRSGSKIFGSGSSAANVNSNPFLANTNTTPSSGTSNPFGGSNSAGNNTGAAPSAASLNSEGGIAGRKKVVVRRRKEGL
eukprot:CAMPEP_0114975806 /NCGR_PEP_ID=MMETSP0216-20121206/2312_1 /TAXON_ID=223996 /ORGANISM="Protocruzia adherens, Strain Boccale" /LENGTH=1361 /DNA_ID=CAMNT_0002336645 /DNA_START=671 /DNA_END=4756 /DNA_ORIENTATION=+